MIKPEVSASMASSADEDLEELLVSTLLLKTSPICLNYKGAELSICPRTCILNFACKF